VRTANAATGLPDGVRLQGLALPTLRRRLAAIASRHATAGLATPTDHPLVRKMLRRYARSRGTAVQKKDYIGYTGLAPVLALKKEAKSGSSREAPAGALPVARTWLVSRVLITHFSFAGARHFPKRGSMTVAGVDCHRDTHTIVLLDVAGRELDAFTIGTTSEGYRTAMDRAAPHGEVVWGLEGSGLYGRAFADALLASGAIVYEVPGWYTRRYRKRAKGKSDRIDAAAVAEAVLREADRLPRPDRHDEQEAVRLLYDRRHRLSYQQTSTINRLRTVAVRLDLKGVPRYLNRAPGIARLRGMVAELPATTATQSVLIREIGKDLDEVALLSAEIRDIDRQLAPFVERLAPELLELRGVSTVVAAGLIGHSGGSNCRDANAFAMRAGVAPVPCSSGRRETVRLNLHGDRQLNRCLHIMAIMQMRSAGHSGHVYYQRKRHEGKTHREAIRALKRQLATVVYHRLKSPTATPRTAPVPRAA
jgi:transposase